MMRARFKDVDYTSQHSMHPGELQLPSGVEVPLGSGFTNETLSLLREGLGCGGSSPAFSAFSVPTSDLGIGRTTPPTNWRDVVVGCGMCLPPTCTEVSKKLLAEGLIGELKYTKCSRQGANASKNRLS